MRIGIITQYFYPITGGVTEHVYYSAKGLSELGHEVSIITSKFLSGNHIDNGLNVIRIGWNVRSPLPFNGSFGNFNIGYQIGNKLRDICMQKKFDLVHIHSPLDPILPWVSLKLSIPKIATFHTAYSTYNLAYDLVKYTFINYVNRLDGRIAVSQTAKDFTNKYFPGQYIVIPNGVDTQRFNPHVKPIEKFNDGTFNILFVGRMEPRKGIKYLVKAFPLIFEHYPKCRLIIVGNGWLKEYYRMYLSKEMLKNVFFEGYVSREDLPRYYATADVFCAPAIGGESFGIVLLEAMASGKPIVASSIKGYSELIADGQEGILVPRKDSMAIKEAVIKLIKDKKLRQKMGQQGCIKAQKYGWDKISKEIENYYCKILNSI